MTPREHTAGWRWARSGSEGGSGPMVRKSLLGLALLGSIGLLGHEAAANVSSVAGASFIPYNASQYSYVTGQSYGGLRNTSSSFVDVVAQIPYQSGKPVYASVGITNQSRCYAVVTNGVGNGAWVGGSVYGSAPSFTWQNLSLGTPLLAAGTALIVHCILEPNGVIGVAYQ
jgi:hypothetical protein